MAQNCRILQTPEWVAAFITRDGEAIEGDALDDVHVLGVVTSTIIDVRQGESPV